MTDEAIKPCNALSDTTYLSHPLPLFLRVSQLILQLLQLLAQLVVVRVVGVLAVVVVALGVGHPVEDDVVVVPAPGRVLDALHQVLRLDLLPVEGGL